MVKTALISGISGQDGSFLADLLIKKNYVVHGIIRRSSSFNTARIDHLYNDHNIMNKKLFLHYGDLTDSSNLFRLIENIRPDEIYNLGAQSHVKVSFDIPEYTTEVDALGTLRFLEAIKNTGVKTKFYQASTSELFGNSGVSAMNEKTPFNPQSPYAIAKLYSYWIVKNYREAYNIFASNGILFNHESERRGKTFVSRKISIGIAKIMLGMIDNLKLGNLDAKRDWGYAPEYAYGMWKILQAKKSDDFVLATGETNTVRDFVNRGFEIFGEKIIWEGKGLQEKGVMQSSGKTVILIDPQYFRPTEVDFLLGDPSKAKKELAWKPKTSFFKLVEIMISHDFNKLKK